jgi:hypothetical protein
MVSGVPCALSPLAPSSFEVNATRGRFQVGRSRPLDEGCAGQFIRQTRGLGSQVRNVLLDDLVDDPNLDVGVSVCQEIA